MLLERKMENAIIDYVKKIFDDYDVINEARVFCGMLSETNDILYYCNLSFINYLKSDYYIDCEFTDRFGYESVQVKIYDFGVIRFISKVHPFDDIAYNFIDNVRDEILNDYFLTLVDKVPAPCTSILDLLEIDIEEETEEIQEQEREEEAQTEEKTQEHPETKDDVHIRMTADEWSSVRHCKKKRIYDFNDLVIGKKYFVTCLCLPGVLRDDAMLTYNGILPKAPSNKSPQYIFTFGDSGDDWRKCFNIISCKSNLRIYELQTENEAYIKFMR